MQNKTSILLMVLLTVGLICSLLLPSALADAEADALAADEAAYRALRSETTVPAATNTPPEGTPVLSSRRGSPSKFSQQGSSKFKQSGSSKLSQKAKGPFFLVKIEQFDGSDDFSVMIDSQIKKSSALLKRESTKIRAAYRLAQKAWKAEETTPYPFACPKARRLQRRQRYLDRQKATEKLSALHAGKLKMAQEVRKKKQDLKKKRPAAYAKIKAKQAAEDKSMGLFTGHLEDLMEQERKRMQAAANNRANNRAGKSDSTELDIPLL